MNAFIGIGDVEPGNVAGGNIDRGDVATKRSKLAICISAILLAHGASLTAAQAAEDDGALLNEVVVTGTRVADRTRLDTLAPVDVLTTESLSSHATTELAQALSTTAPSLNFPRPAITDGTDHIRPAALRGLAPDQTLVLVNSKRRHQSALVNVNGTIGRGSAAVDLNAIPMAAVSSVEVLRDGASAQYGSDAIAGVINLRLREAREGGSGSITYGKYDTEVNTALLSRHESDGETLTLSTWTGLPLGDEGFLTLSAEYRDRDGTSRGDLDTRATPARVRSRYGDAQVKDATFYANAGIPMGDDWNIYSWLGYQKRKGESAATPRVPSNANSIAAIYPDGFLPIIATDIRDIAVGWGINGDIAGWKSDFSIVYGRNRVDYRTEHSVNGSLGAASPTDFYSGAMAYDQLAVNAGFVHEFDWGLAGPANVALGVEARRETYAISAGEPDSYRIGPTPPAGTTGGAQGFGGFQPANEVDESRQAFGAYADVEAQVAEKFLASAAVRAEKYSDFGSSVTGKLSGRYDFVHEFALRATASTGFRAPGLQQSFFSSTATNFVAGNPVPFEVGTFPATSPVAQALGAKPLDAEKSKNFSLGAVLRLPNFEATLDGYRIDITDRIVLSENLGTGGVNAAGVAAFLAPFNVGAARFFINGVDTRTTGVDLVLHYQLLTEVAGKYDFTLLGNKNKTEVTRVPSTPVLAALNPAPPLFARVNTLTFEVGTPDTKLGLGVDWKLPLSFGSLGTSLKGTRYGKVVEPILAVGAEPETTRDLELDPTWLIDASINAGFLGDKLNFSIGADNLFDQYPNQTPVARPSPIGGAPINLNTNGALSFSKYSPFGFNGRFLYARVSYSW